MTNLLTGGACFVAGTQVLTENGLENIESIEAGDMVWASNPDTGETALKKVVRTYVRDADTLVHLHVGTDEIKATPEHPFYVPQKGWTAAIDLRAGYVLVLSNGEYVVVEKVQHEILETPVKVYNFEVQDFHTYFVGEHSVLVHNTCGRILPYNGTRTSVSNALDMAERYLGPGYKEISNGRFVSADNLRQVRMGVNDILGKHAGGPHLNFDMIYPKYKSVHVYFND